METLLKEQPKHFYQDFASYYLGINSIGKLLSDSLRSELDSKFRTWEMLRSVTAPQKLAELIDILYFYPLPDSSQIKSARPDYLQFKCKVVKVDDQEDLRNKVVDALQDREPFVAFLRIGNQELPLSLSLPSSLPDSWLQTAQSALSSLGIPAQVQGYKIVFNVELPIVQTYQFVDGDLDANLKQDPSAKVRLKNMHSGKNEDMTFKQFFEYLDFKWPGAKGDQNIYQKHLKIEPRTLIVAK